MSHRWTRIGHALLALGAVLALAACTSPSPASPTAPTPAPTPVRIVSWRLQLENQDQASFGLRVSLDGERIYDHSGQPAVFHLVEVERLYAAGTHTIECEVVGVRQSPSVYRAAVTVSVEGGLLFHGDGVPASLTAGDVLTLRVPL